MSPVVVPMLRLGQPLRLRACEETSSHWRDSGVAPVNERQRHWSPIKCGGELVYRHGTLERCRDDARQQVEALKRQVEDEPGGWTRKQQAARARVARERDEKVRKALDRLPELEQIKEQQGKNADEARASTTDTEATVMKMGDGGFRPAYNAQLAKDTASQVIVGMETVTNGSDMAPLAPMVEQVTARCGQSPEQWLVDGGFPAPDQLDVVADATTVYAPVPKPKDPATDPHAAKAGDSAAVATWHERMGHEDAKRIYRERAATAERVNALARNRGLIQLRVRGHEKVRCVLRLHARAHNLMRTVVSTQGRFFMPRDRRAVGVTDRFCTGCRSATGE